MDWNSQSRKVKSGPQRNRLPDTELVDFSPSKPKPILYPKPNQNCSPLDSDSVYKSLSVTDTTCPELFRLQRADFDEPLFSTVQSQKSVPRPRWAIPLAVVILLSITILGITAVVHELNSSSVSQFEPQNDTQPNITSLAFGTSYTEDEDDIVIVVNVTDQPPTATLKFPIPDLKTREGLEFSKELLTGPRYFVLPSFKMANVSMLMEALRVGEEALVQRETTEARLRQLGLMQNISEAEDAEVLKMSLTGFSMDRASRSLVKRLNLGAAEAADGIAVEGGEELTPNGWCAKLKEPLCDHFAVYRSLNATCNNLRHPNWGAAREPYRRILLPQYRDGISSGRASEDGSELPNPFQLSTWLFRKKTDYEARVSKLFSLWADFVGEDMDDTVRISESGGISCCENGTHPLEIQHPDCFPIYDNDGDGQCSTVLRSGAAPSCFFGPREQFSRATGFLDGSSIYTSKRQLGNSSGSSMLNFHSLWTRHHSRLTAALSQVNPQWDKGLVEQEARRIVVAQIQHITYREYLPLLLGPELMERAGLRLLETGYFDYKLYDQGINPSLSNAFAAAASKFIHYLNPNTSEVIHMGGIDIQRGRDHGLPGYSAFRNVCGLEPVQSFSELAGLWEPEHLNNSLYKTFEDVDLFVGGFAELSLEGSILGPTFGSIVADQFARARQGDRYWYEGDSQPKPFTPAQLTSIRGTTLALILCENMPFDHESQPEALKPVSKENPLQPCQHILRSSELDLLAWKEAVRVTGIKIPAGLSN